MACGGECSRGDEHRVGAADDIVRDGRADRLVARPVVDQADVERRICGRVEVRARWVNPMRPQAAAARQHVVMSPALVTNVNSTPCASRHEHLLFRLADLAPSCAPARRALEADPDPVRVAVTCLEDVAHGRSAGGAKCVVHADRALLDRPYDPRRQVAPSMDCTGLVPSPGARRRRRPPSAWASA